MSQKIFFSKIYFWVLPHGIQFSNFSQGSPGRAGDYTVSCFGSLGKHHWGYRWNRWKPPKIPQAEFAFYLGSGLLRQKEPRCKLISWCVERWGALQIQSWYIPSRMCVCLYIHIYMDIYTYICVDNIYILCIPISTFKIVVSGMRCNESRLLFGLFWPGSAVGLRWICIWELVRMAKPCWWILANNHWDWLTLDHQYSMKYNNIYIHIWYINIVS